MAHSGRRNADEALAAALASGRTVREASASAGVAERTAFRRLEDPGFVARVAQLRTTAIAAAMNRLGSSMTAAADTLADLLAHRDPHVKFKAAKAVLEVGMRLREQIEVEERLAAVERALKGERNEQPDQGATQTGRDGDEEGDYTAGRR